MLREAVDERPIYVGVCQEVVQEITENGKQPSAIYVQLHFADGSMVRFQRRTRGFNRLIALGALEVEKADILDDIIEAEDEPDGAG